MKCKNVRTQWVQAIMQIKALLKGKVESKSLENQNQKSKTKSG